MAGYIGGKVAVSAPQQIETKHTITATASQTSIPNVGYTVGAVHVYQNGIRLVDGTDYTATNGSTVTLETGATEGDQIVIVSHGSFETSDTVSKASGGTFSAGITVNGAVNANSLVVPDGSIPLVDLDIDGGTDIGAALVDADLMVVDDGAGGTNRKATMSRLATYMGTKIGGGMEFLASSGAISNGTASVIFNQFDASKYDYYIFNILTVVPVNDSVQILMQLSADGTNYDSTNGNYHEETTDKTGLIVSPENVAGASGELNGASITAKLYNIHSTTAKTALDSRGIYQDADPKIIRVARFSNYEASAAAHTAVKILFSSGNIESGEITMFGVVNS